MIMFHSFSFSFKQLFWPKARPEEPPLYSWSLDRGMAYALLPFKTFFNVTKQCLLKFKSALQVEKLECVMLENILYAVKYLVMGSHCHSQSVWKLHKINKSWIKVDQTGILEEKKKKKKKGGGGGAEDQNTQTNSSKDCSFVDVFVSVLGWYNNMANVGIDGKTPQMSLFLFWDGTTLCKCGDRQ